MGSKLKVVAGVVGVVVLAALSYLCAAVLAVALLFDNYDGHNWRP